MEAARIGVIGGRHAGMEILLGVLAAGFQRLVFVSVPEQQTPRTPAVPRLARSPSVV